MTDETMEFPENVRRLRELISPCTLCPMNCSVDRAAGKTGACRIGPEAVVVSAGAHFGEEPVLVGPGGSGTIFLAGCNLHCIFCQNADISQSADGRAMSSRELADIALRLEQDGCANVNFVTPTHVSHAVAEAIVLARRDGLQAPVVYNCGGYESVRTLQLLEGLVDIYMPDFKWANRSAGFRYSNVADYPKIATAALAEMYRQVGPLRVDREGLATRGLLVRHLVMPNDLARSEEVIDIVARTAPGCALNVMAQYRPCYRAEHYQELASRPVPADVRALQSVAADQGLQRPE